MPTTRHPILRLTLVRAADAAAPAQYFMPQENAYRIVRCSATDLLERTPQGKRRHRELLRRMEKIHQGANLPEELPEPINGMLSNAWVSASGEGAGSADARVQDIESYIRWLDANKGYIFNRIPKYSKYIERCNSLVDSRGEPNCARVYFAVELQVAVERQLAAATLQGPEFLESLEAGSICGFAVVAGNDEWEGPASTPSRTDDSKKRGRLRVPREVDHAREYLGGLHNDNLWFRFVSPISVDKAHRGRRLGRDLLDRIETEAEEDGVHLIAGLVHARNFYAISGLSRLGYSFLDWTPDTTRGKGRAGKPRNRPGPGLDIWFRICKLLASEQFAEPEDERDPSDLYLQLTAAFNLLRASRLFGTGSLGAGATQDQALNLGPVPIRIGRTQITRGGWVYHDPSRSEGAGLKVGPPFGETLQASTRQAFRCLARLKADRVRWGDEAKGHPALVERDRKVAQDQLRKACYAVLCAYDSLDRVSGAKDDLGKYHPLVRMLLAQKDKRDPKWIVLMDVRHARSKEQHHEESRKVGQAIKKALAFLDTDPCIIPLESPFSSSESPTSEGPSPGAVPVESSGKRHHYEGLGEGLHTVAEGQRVTVESVLRKTFEPNGSSAGEGWENLREIYESFRRADLACYEEQGLHVWLHLIGQTYRTDPAASRESETLVGTFFSFVATLPNDNLEGIVNTLWRTVSRPVYRLAMRKEDYLLREELHRSTLVETMARSVSHNIGSHVLSFSSILGPLYKQAGGNVEHWNRVRDVDRLLKYLHRRLDFVAQASTWLPSSSEPVLFFADLVSELRNQDLIFQHLLLGWSESPIRLRVSMGSEAYPGESDTVYEWNLGQSWESDSEDQRFPDERFLYIGGGFTGMHAVYIIAENLLRNTVMHAPIDGNGRPLELCLHLRQGNRSALILWTNWDDHTKERKAVFVDEIKRASTIRGRGKSGMHRGFLEIERCAAILRANHGSREPGQENPANCSAIKVHDPRAGGESRGPYVGIEVRLKKHWPVTVLGSLFPESRLIEKNGIVRRVTNIRKGGSTASQLVVVDQQALSEMHAASPELTGNRMLIRVESKARRVSPPLWIEVAAADLDDCQHLAGTSLELGMYLWAHWLAGFIRRAKGAESHVVLTISLKGYSDVRKHWAEVLKDLGEPVAKILSGCLSLRVVHEPSQSRIVVPPIPRSSKQDQAADDRTVSLPGLVPWPYLGQGQPLAQNMEKWEAQYVSHEVVVSTPADIRRCFRQDLGEGYHPLKSNLHQPPSDAFTALVVVSGLVEASLTKVLVLDERLIAHLLGPGKDADSRTPEFGGDTKSALEEAGIYPLLSARVGSGSSSKSSKVPPLPNASFGKESPFGLSLCLRHGRAARISGINSKGDEVDELITEYDVLVIHPPILRLFTGDRTLGQALLQFRAWLGLSASDKTRVVLTTASMTRDETTDLPLLDFSIIEQALLTRDGAIEKYHLVRALNSIRTSLEAPGGASEALPQEQSDQGLADDRQDIQPQAGPPAPVARAAVGLPPAEAVAIAELVVIATAIHPVNHSQHPTRDRATIDALFQGHDRETDIVLSVELGSPQAQLLAADGRWTFQCHKPESSPRVVLLMRGHAMEYSTRTERLLVGGVEVGTFLADLRSLLGRDTFSAVNVWSHQGNPRGDRLEREFVAMRDYLERDLFHAFEDGPVPDKGREGGRTIMGKWPAPLED